MISSCNKITSFLGDSALTCLTAWVDKYLVDVDNVRHIVSLTGWFTGNTCFSNKHYSVDSYYIFSKRTI